MRPSIKLIVCAAILLLMTACVLPTVKQADVTPQIITVVVPATSQAPAESATATPAALVTVIMPTTAAVTPEVPATPLRFEAPAGLAAQTVSAADGNPPELRSGVWIVPTGFEGMNDCSMGSGLRFGNPPVTQVTIPGQAIYGTVFDTCGWAQDESVSIQLTLPDGTLESSVSQADSLFGVSAYYHFGYGSQLGQYHVRFSGSSGQLEHSFSLDAPLDPGMLYTVDYGAYFHHLAPNERVVVGAYNHVENGGYFDLVGWGVFNADASGNLLVQNSTAGDYLVGVGDVNGLMRGPSLMDIFLESAGPFTIPPCAGAPASRLANGGVVRVTLGGGPNNLRAEPGTSSSWVGEVPPGGRMILTHEEPICAGNMLWWNVWTLDQAGAGWTSEGQGSSYWLEPWE